MIILNILLAIIAIILFFGVVAEKDAKKHTNITIAFVADMAAITLLNLIEKIL